MKTMLTLSLLLLTLSSHTRAAEPLTMNERAQWEHMTIGSNFYPYVWFKALNSVTFVDENKLPSKPVYTNVSEMEKRYGIKKSNFQEVEVNGVKRKFVIPLAGMSVSWSNHDPVGADAYADETQLTRSINGVKSAKFVGINCAYCHQSELMAGGTKAMVLGAPSQVDVNGYYTELIMSTAAMFMKVELLEGFLQRVKLQNPELTALNPKVDAAKIQLQFKKDVGVAITGNPNSYLNSMAYYWTLLSAKYLKNKEQFRKINLPLKNAYISLYRITHNLSAVDKIGEVEDFAEWFSRRGVGDELHVKKTPYYFGRSDALGSFGNAEVRGKEAVNLTAPVSFPWIWGIKYMTFAHYGANMNSPVQRNIGAALAVGATYSFDKKRTSVNLATVDYLESLIYRIAPPKWNQVFKDVADTKAYQINETRVAAGKKHYEQQCMTCHETNKFVGPENNLRDYKIFPLTALGTDPNAAVNVVTSVNGTSFGVAGARITSKIAELYFNSNKISIEDQVIINKTDLRGTAFMRDTFLGFDKQQELGLNYGNIAKGAGYKARHLAGVWATAPFLHNNTVPTLLELLIPAKDRAKAFYVSGIQNFDPARVGLTTVRMTGCPKVTKESSPFDICINTELPGNSNQGHEFGVNLTLEQKLELIEYLKVLPAEPEYDLGMN